MKDPLFRTLTEVERDHIEAHLRLLEEGKYSSLKEVAQALGITRHALARRLKTYGLTTHRNPPNGGTRTLLKLG